MSSSGMSAGEVWQVFWFLVLPLLVCYVGLLVWSCKRDRGQR
jgi:hypothetical protein